MAPIPVYSSSPINAAKAQGATPNTAGNTKPSPASAAARPAAAAPTSPTPQKAYPPAQPGAQPSLPVQTGAPPQPHNSFAPTPTKTAQSSSPPAPQPGAAPEPPKANIPPPPPPKTGESLKAEHVGSSSSPPEGMPPQMSYQAPTVSPPAKSRGTASAIPQPQPQLFGTGEGGVQADPSHPPGYHQDVNASEFNSYQRAAHNAYVSESSSFGDSGDGSIWDQAKKWASAAGDSLAAAEHEVWKKINKE